MSLFNFSDTIAAFGAQELTLSRYGAPTRSGGFATKPAPTAVYVSAVVWPSTGTELRLLEEGFRSMEARTLATTTPLRAAVDPDVAYPDRFTYEGSTWEIQNVTDWATGGGVYLGVAIKLAG